MTVGAVHTNKLTSTLSLEDKAGWGIFRPKPDTNQPTTLQGDMIITNMPGYNSYSQYTIQMYALVMNTIEMYF